MSTWKILEVNKNFEQSVLKDYVTFTSLRMLIQRALKQLESLWGGGRHCTMVSVWALGPSCLGFDSWHYQNLL